jgi:hypothetical protein
MILKILMLCLLSLIKGCFSTKAGSEFAMGAVNDAVFEAYTMSQDYIYKKRRLNLHNCE